MAQIYPFRALRYDTSRVRMEDVVTQPYDKISPAMQQRYYETSPYNLIRIILGKHEPADTEPQDFLPAGERAHNVYTRAANYLASWRKEDILREESEPALYGYSQTYTVPGTSEVRERRGFIALGHLYDYADKVVYRHEQTFPKHKSDRLALFKATRAYCEQIYMLYSDPAFTAEKLIFGADSGSAQHAVGHAQNAPDLTITDEYQVVHRVWRLTDPTLINLIVTAMADKKLIIADGHHRYETSVAYAKERSAQLNLPFGHRRDENDGSPSNLADAYLHPDQRANLAAPPFPEAAMMMTFVNMDAPGITILPTHRVVTGLAAAPATLPEENGGPTDGNAILDTAGGTSATAGSRPDPARGFSSPDFLTRASALYTITELDPTNPTISAAPPAEIAATAATKLLATLNATAGHAFVAVTLDGNYLLQPRPEAVAPLLAQLSPKQRQLEVAELHTVLLDHLLGLTPDRIKATGNISYLRDAGEAIALVQSNAADLAFLIKPITLDQLKDVSLSGDVMPQKSTDFYPKLLSGLAIYALD